MLQGRRGDHVPLRPAGMAPSRPPILLSLWRSQSVRGAAIFAFSGTAFAAGNLLLALKLSTTDYGSFALVVAVLVLSSSIAPLGLDQLMLRRHIPLTRRSMTPLLASATVVAVIAAAFTFYAYGLAIIEIMALALATVTAAVLRTVAGSLRRHGHAMTANMVDTSSDWIILLISLLAVVGVISTGTEATIGYLIGLFLVTLAGGLLLRHLERHSKAPVDKIDFKEAGSLLGIATAGAALVQLERLLIPLLLSLTDLATFAVLAAVAIAPFRVMGSGIVTSLAQQIRRANGPEARRKALLHETQLFGGLLVLACGFVLIVAPWAADVLTGGKYHVSFLLAAAACINGVGKVLQALPRAVIVGAGSRRDLHGANLSIWLCVLGTIIGSLIGYRAGLAGLVAGAAVGNIVATLPLAIIARRMLKPKARSGAV